jgi:hypothetical protein
MIKAESGKKACPGLVFGKTTVIVFAILGRRVQDNCHPFLKDEGKRIKDKIDLPLSWPTIVRI